MHLLFLITVQLCCLFFEFTFSSLGIWIVFSIFPVYYYYLTSGVWSTLLFALGSGLLTDFMYGHDFPITGLVLSLITLFSFIHSKKIIIGGSPHFFAIGCVTCLVTVSNVFYYIIFYGQFSTMFWTGLCTILFAIIMNVLLAPFIILILDFLTLQLNLPERCDYKNSSSLFEWKK